MTYIAIIIFILAFSAAACALFYLRGHDRGGRDMIDKLSLHGEASLLPIPYDIICEEYAEHMKQYILVLKREHDVRMTNRKEYTYEQHQRERLHKKDRERKSK